MKPFTNFYRLFCLLTLCICAASCSGNASIKGLVPCQGTVTLDGKSLSDAKINFVPKTKTGTERSAVGMSDGIGTFEVSTAVGNKGIFPGEYSVIVSKYTYATDEDRIVDMDRQKNGTNGVKFVTEGDEMKAIRTINGKEYPDNVNMQSLVPPKYTDVQTSDLKIIIPASGNKKIRLELVGN
jgi:hypothetical protein